MISFSDVVERALHGPIMPESEFDQDVFMMKVADVVDKYDIEYDGNQVVVADDDLADRIFQAALELYSEVGTYCISSNRVIRFTRDEILDAMRDYSKRGVFGQGIDAKAIPRRSPECDIPPYCSVGACGGVVSSEEVMTSLVRGYAQIPKGDGICTPSLGAIDGVPIQADTPLEIEGCIRNVTLVKDALARAGRPGKPIVNGVASASTDVATIAADAFGLTKWDAWEVSAVAELKIDFSVLNKIAYLRRKGGQQWAATAPILGGYCGGPEGTAVVQTAYNLQALMINNAEVHHPFCNHIHYGTNTGREMLWTVSASAQAITRNSPVPITYLCFAGGGPMTDMIFCEIAAWALAAITSGANAEMAAVALNKHPDHTTPYEPRAGTEVCHAIVGMSRTEANAIALKLLAEYEKLLVDPPIGRNYRDVFNIETSTPKAEYRKFYQSIMKKLKEDFGIPLSFN
jgi:methylamine---corrinoid protein Co-methyltransferase